MNVSLVLTAIGDDRPGLVEALSQAVADCGGSWQESHMARLAGKFAGILRAELPGERAADLEAALHGLQTGGLRVVVESTGDAPADKSRNLVQLELVGNDRAGIVHEISQALAARGVNIDELNTVSESVPMTGGLLFKATASLSLPGDVSLDDLRTLLEGLANDLVVDLSPDQENG